jgi:hypothetical protein
MMRGDGNGQTWGSSTHRQGGAHARVPDRVAQVPARGPSSTCPSVGRRHHRPNHTSVLDSFFVPALLPRRVTYVGKAEYMDDWKTKYSSRPWA